MGTPIPDDTDMGTVAEGVSCTSGWGPGKPFGDGPTPNVLGVNFADMEKGPGWLLGDPEPIDGFFEVAGQGTFACRWFNITVDLQLQVETGSSGVFVDARIPGSTILFKGGTLGLFELYVPYDGFSKYQGGSALVIIPEVA